MKYSSRHSFPLPSWFYIGISLSIFRTRPLFNFLGLISISVLLIRASPFLIDNQHSKDSFINMYYDPVSGTPPSLSSPPIHLLPSSAPATVQPGSSSSLFISFYSHRPRNCSPPWISFMLHFRSGYPYCTSIPHYIGTIY